jgi:glucose/arabinose dehydrogenase
MRRAALLLVILGACGGDDTPAPIPPECSTPIHGTNVTFRLVAETQGAAILVTSPPNDPRRFVVEQEGRIKELTATGLSAPFLDISNDDDFACCGEQGLLGLAFHPKFATNRQLFVFYTKSDANILARYEMSATDATKIDKATKKILLSIPDFAGNHNGGMIEFGADGKLYIGTGDGGGGGDPQKNGQNPDALLGKMLRLDVDKADAVPEEYLLGLRNPWRWSFDRETGDMWIGDVGQDQVEELDLLPKGTPAGTNLGWNMYEGPSCYAQPCDATNKTMPQFTKAHGEGWCSIIGGQVYRGGCYPDVKGTYYFTDYCKHELWSATKSGDQLVTTKLASKYIDGSGTSHDGSPPTPSSLHADSRGEMYMTTTEASASSRGGVWRMEVGP